MTVGELINELSKFNPDQVIGEWLNVSGSYEYHPFTIVGYEGDKLTIF